MDADRDALAVRFLARDSFDVDEVFQTVNGSDFALAAFVRPSGNDDLVIFSDWNAANLCAIASSVFTCRLWDEFEFRFPTSA